MPFNGSGVYTRVRNWLADANASINIEPALHDTEDDSIATAFNLCWNRDGQSAATANIPMGGFNFTNLGNGSADTDSISLGQANGLYLLKAQLAAGFAVNASITSSVASNALTIALKNAAGSDPSTASPVLLPFRSATATDGAITVRSVTAANSITINSTATLGTANSTPFSIWVVAFDNAGTIQLGVINCLATNATQIGVAPLQPNSIASAVLEDNTSDLAGSFYSASSSVSAKPYVILGRLIWNTGLTTAGTWDANADVKAVFGPGMRLPGDTIQRVIAFDAAVATGTTAIPQDDTIPQNTEGTQFMSQAIIPTSPANILRITHIGSYAHSNALATNVVAALFQDSTANALAAQWSAKDASAGSPAEVVLQHTMLAATSSSTTIKIRAGQSNGATTTFNGTGGARVFGGAQASSLVIEEIVA